MKSVSRLTMLVSLLSLGWLASCQVESTPEPTGSGPMTAYASFNLLDSSLAPDGANWRSRSDSGRGGLTCNRLLECTDTITLKDALGHDTVHLQLNFLGVRIATLEYTQTDRNPSLNLLATFQRDTSTIRLLKEFLQLRQTKSDSFSTSTRTAASNFTAYFASAVYSGRENLSRTLPFGMSLDSVKTELVLLATRSAKSWSQLAAMGFGLDSTSIHDIGLQLLRSGQLASSDSATLFPAYPLRVLTSLVLGADPVKGGDPVTISGSFSWAPGRTINAPQLSVRTAQGTDSVHFKFPTIRFLPGDTVWTISGNLTLQTTADAPLGTDTLVITLTDGSGHSVSARVTFTVKAAPTGLDSALSSISTNPGILGSAFSPAKTNYSVLVPPGTASLVVTATPRTPADIDSILYNGSSNTAVALGTADPTRISIRVVNLNHNSLTYTLDVIHAIPDTAKAPLVNPPGGPFASAQTVTLSSATDSAKLFYTLDGSAPTTASTPYTGPVTVSSSLTLKAIATKAGLIASPVSSAAFVFQARDSSLSALSTTPGAFTASFIAGTTEYVDSVGSETTTLAVNATPNVPADVDSVLYNGSTGNAIALGASDPTTISVQIRNRNGNRLTYKIRVFHKAPATPTISPASGSYSNPQSVEITCATAGTTIRYTTDGSAPSASSSLYTAPFPISTTKTVKAAAIGNGGVVGPVASAVFTFDTAQATTFSPAAGSYATAQSVTIATTISGATIHFTTDGSAPTAASATYTAPIPLSVTTTLKAIATKEGMANSGIASATYTFDTVQAPTFTPPTGSYASAQSVTIASATPGAAIHFTTDGSVPTAASATYTEPLPVQSTSTLQAIATKSGLATSSVTSASYTFDTTTTPTISPAAGTYVGSVDISLASASAGATIYYTTDGTKPTESSSIYLAPFSLNASKTVKAFAVASGSAASPVASASYTIVPDTAKAPVFSPAGGTYYTGARTVTLASSTPGATIYYTTDGTAPTTASTKYVGPVAIDSNRTLIAIATKSGFVSSPRAIATYVIKNAQYPWNQKATYSTMMDVRDSQTYVTVKIGDQNWMAQNLNYSAGGTVGKCPGDLEANCAIYGRIYTWTEAMATATSSATSPSGVTGLCPSGWHHPSQAEWKTLQKLANPANDSDATNLKSTTGWYNSGNGTDSLGFRALPGGCGSTGFCAGFNYYATFWSATEQDSYYGYSKIMSTNSAYAYPSAAKAYTFSVRCVQ